MRAAGLRLLARSWADRQFSGLKIVADYVEQSVAIKRFSYEVVTARCKTLLVAALPTSKRHTQTRSSLNNLLGQPQKHEYVSSHPDSIT